MVRTLKPQLFVYLAGAIEGLLLARLTARLFAARPDHPAFKALLAVTEPLRAPLAALDTGQPQFGATLEYSTLVMLVVLPALAVLVWRVLRKSSGVRAGYR